MSVSPRCGTCSPRTSTRGAELGAAIAITVDGVLVADIWGGPIPGVAYVMYKMGTGLLGDERCHACARAGFDALG